MRAFQSRSSAVVGAGSFTSLVSPSTPCGSPQAVFPSSSVLQRQSAAFHTGSRNSRSLRSSRSGIQGLVAPASMGLFTQRCGIADTTKAVAGLSGYSDITYNEESDHFLQSLEETLSEYEEKNDGRIEDVDFQSAVLNIQTHKGTFILNKQAPKLQLWLSSPISGPTHYDRVKGTEEDPDKVWWRCDRHGKNLEELLSKELGSVLGLDGPLELNINH